MRCSPDDLPHPHAVAADVRAQGFVDPSGYVTIRFGVRTTSFIQQCEMQQWWINRLEMDRAASEISSEIKAAAELAAAADADAAAEERAAGLARQLSNMARCSTNSTLRSRRRHLTLTSAYRAPMGPV